MTRVLFICPNLKLGGAERQWSILVPSLGERQFDVRVLTLDGEGPFFGELKRAGVEITCAGMRNRADPGGLRRAMSASSWRPGVVVTRSVSALGIGHVLARRTGARHVANEHVDYALLPPLRPHRRRLMKMLAPRVDAAVAVAESQLHSLVAHGFVRERIRVIPNGVPAAWPHTLRPVDEVRQELGVRSDDFLAALVAGLRPEKRVEHFVSAVSYAHRVDPRISAIVVGGGPLLERVRSAAAESGGAVRVLGPRLDAESLMAAADVVCLTSSHEAMPMVLLEAMALGRPVVSTSLGGVPELVRRGRTGMLVAVGDDRAFALALLELASDRNRARAMGAAGRDLQRDLFSADRMVDSYATLIGGLGGRRR